MNYTTAHMHRLADDEENTNSSSDEAKENETPSVGQMASTGKVEEDEEKKREHQPGDFVL